MAYKPRIVTGKVTGTGWPIDGHVLHFTQWDYDNHENFHLYGWEDEDDEAVMLTMFQSETESGFCTCDTLEEFTEMWKAKKWEPQAAFVIPLNMIEVQEVKQEEVKDDAREKLIAHGIDLTPRKSTDKGGILCLPMEKNLNGDIKAKHPDWELIDCPNCARKCWKTPGADRMVEEQGAQLLCTECAIEAGLVAPYRPKTSPPPQISNPLNRAQRRRAKKYGKRNI